MSGRPAYRIITKSFLPWDLKLQSIDGNGHFITFKHQVSRPYPLRLMEISWQTKFFTLHHLIFSINIFIQSQDFKHYGRMLLLHFSINKRHISSYSFFISTRPIFCSKLGAKSLTFGDHLKRLSQSLLSDTLMVCFKYDRQQYVLASLIFVFNSESLSFWGGLILN